MIARVCALMQTGTRTLKAVLPNSLEWAVSSSALLDWQGQPGTQDLALGCLGLGLVIVPRCTFGQGVCLVPGCPLC